MLFRRTPNGEWSYLPTHGEIKTSSGSGSLTQHVWDTERCGKYTYFTDCVNFGTVATGEAQGAAGGFVGYFGGYMSRIVGATDCTFLNCANFSSVRAKLAAGLAADLSINTGWGTGVYRIDNCANYGEVTGPTNAQLVAKFVSAKSGCGQAHYRCALLRDYLTDSTYCASDLFWPQSEQGEVVWRRHPPVFCAL